MPSKCETEHLILRSFTKADLHALAPIFADPQIKEISPHGVKSFEQTERFIDYAITHTKNGIELLAVIHKQDKKLIGFCGLIWQEVDGKQEVELAYRIAREYWGQGLATEAAQAVRDHALTTLKLTRLISLIDPTNIRSIRVAQKVGMLYEKQATFKARTVDVVSTVDVYSIEKKGPRHEKNS